MQLEKQRRMSSGSNHSWFSNTTDMDSVAEEAEDDDITRGSEKFQSSINSLITKNNTKKVVVVVVARQ